MGAVEAAAVEERESARRRAARAMCSMVCLEGREIGGEAQRSGELFAQDHEMG